MRQVVKEIGIILAVVVISAGFFFTMYELSFYVLPEGFSV